MGSRPRCCAEAPPAVVLKPLSSRSSNDSFLMYLSTITSTDENDHLTKRLLTSFSSPVRPLTGDRGRVLRNLTDPAALLTNGGTLPPAHLLLTTTDNQSRGRGRFWPLGRIPSLTYTNVNKFNQIQSLVMHSRSTAPSPRCIYPTIRLAKRQKRICERILEHGGEESCGFE